MTTNLPSDAEMDRILGLGTPLHPANAAGRMAFALGAEEEAGFQVYLTTEDLRDMNRDYVETHRRQFGYGYAAARTMRDFTLRATAPVTTNDAYGI